MNDGHTIITANTGEIGDGWKAYLDGYESGNGEPIALGETELQAIEDLLEIIRDREEKKLKVLKEQEEKKNMNKDKCKWVTVRQLAELYPFGEGGIRNLLFFSKTNGLEKCVRRIGSKILINTDQFDEWIDGHKDK
jgi:hypothetical protein